MTGKLGGSMLESEISADVADFMRKLRNVWFAWWVWGQLVWKEFVASIILCFDFFWFKSLVWRSFKKCDCSEQENELNCGN